MARPDGRAALRIALERLARDGGLAREWTVEQAADWALTRIQPATLQHLVHDRGWAPAEYTERTVGSLLAELTG